MKYLIFLGIMALVQYSNAEETVALTTYDLVKPVLVQEQCIRPTEPDSSGKNTQEMKDARVLYEQKLSVFNSCTDRNVANLNAYSEQMAKYQAALKLQPKEQPTLSAESAAREAQAESKQAKEKSYRVSAGQAVVSGVLATAFAASCAGGFTCQPALLAGSIYFGVSSVKSKQAGEDYKKTESAMCVTGNRLSASGGQADCAGGTPPGVNDLFDANGNCKVAQADCDSIVKQLPAGTNIKDAMKGVSAFASGKGPFKINPDGSATTKDGKTYTSANFASEGAMIASGMSPADAKALMAKIKKNSEEEGVGAKLAALTTQNSALGNYTDSGSLTNTPKTTEVIINGNASGAKDLLGSGKRTVASAEGLVKDFNGEQIGVAGDDIFKMMNRRYKLKVSQDNFISP